jgi:hypothetical protein
VIDPHQIKNLVIIPALHDIGLICPAAVELVFLTGFVESRYKYIAQIGGPALSFWQIEPFTANDHFENYLQFRKDLEAKVRMMMAPNQDIEWNLVNSMAFAAAMCRIKYRRSPMPLPAVGDVAGQAHIWKQAYNTPQGAGTEEKFIQLAEFLL